MKGWTGFWGVLGGIVLVALINVIVRPGSTAPAALNAAGGAFSGSISAAEGDPVTGSSG